jgi:folate-binding protein YgfZ
MVMDKVGREPAGAVAAGSDYQAALTSGTVLRRRDRQFLGVDGKSPGEMLKGIVSGRIPAPLSEGTDGWGEGEASYSAILTPKGRMLTDLRILPDPEGGFLLDLPAAGFENAVPHFRKYLHPRFAQATDRSEALGMLTIVGPGGWSFLSKTLGLEVGPQGPEGVRHRRGNEGSDIWLVGNAEVGLPGIDLVLSLKVLEDVRGRLEELGVRAMGPACWETLRIEAGTPLFGVDMTEDTIPVEAGIHHRAIDHDKGCYIGQEVIIRLRDRGQVNKNLRGLLLGDADPPSSGTELFLVRGGSGSFEQASDEPDGAIGRKVGWITSACRSPGFGQTIALGFIKRGVSLGAEVRLGGPQGSAGVVRSLEEDWAP